MYLIAEKFSSRFEMNKYNDKLLICYKKSNRIIFWNLAKILFAYNYKIFIIIFTIDFLYT